jgi:hypothetical protein
MIVFTAGGDDRQMPTHADLSGLRLEEVVLDFDDALALSQFSDAQLRNWANELRANFIPPKRTH